MRALVIYESMFGNTAAIAKAVTEGLSSRLTVETVEVSAAPKVLNEDVALLVIGAPTHGFNPSRPESRASAATQTDRPLLSAGIGVREWLEAADLPDGLPAAAFGTGVANPRLPGSAAYRIRRRLRRRGGRVVAAPESFWVTWKPCHLQDGELDQARRWGQHLAATTLRRHHPAAPPRYVE